MIDSSAPVSDMSVSRAPMRLVARLVARRHRSAFAAAMRQRSLRKMDALDLLAQDGLPRLALQSFWLLVGSGVAYAGLNIAARAAHGSGPLLGNGPPIVRGAVLLLANVAAYMVMVPLHEALHASTIIALGGRPRFGLKLPLAAYCTAPGQLFTRNGYIAVAVAPLLVLSAVGAAATWIAPDLGACILFGLAGNVSGAIGDLTAIAHIRRLPTSALIEDTATGYAAYAILAEPLAEPLVDTVDTRSTAS